jgi:serine/threonine protein kinase/tetratricopeptide (TPR) repeat protein
MGEKAGQRERVKAILGLALERELAERELFIHEACGDDVELRAEVQSLLAHHDAADSLLETPLLAALDGHSDALLGRRVGTYRILHRIGDGGMAVVYLAERADEQFRKTVAIKLLRPAPHRAEMLRRFRNERQTLAAIDHPNIVRLLDGGTTEEGWPYLVMDYVDGVPIDRYCDEHQLTVEARLRLFCTVCSAVQCAHERSIIHRDLKPANILITKDGVARLLDFGIAKLLAPELLQTEVVTRTGLRPMTPEYASPEQVRGQNVSQASDVYSLGVLLYRLLSGHLPYRTTMSWGDVERAICEQQPAPPSHLLEAHAGRRVRRDLDTIVLKALRKEPQQRYTSVTEFACDIQRHLCGESIAARREPLSSRALVFALRHKESLGAALVILLVLAGVAQWTRRHPQQIVAQSALSAAAAGKRPTVAVLGFRNLSGRTDVAWISIALSEMLDTELAAGERLRMLPAETVTRTRIDLELPDASSLSADTLKRLRQSLGTDFVVLGAYLALSNPDGDQIRLDLRLQDAVRGETVASVSEIGTGADLLALVSRAATKLRRQLGVQEVSLADSTGIRASVPSNPQATRLYAEGITKLRTFDALAARDLLLRAVIADPSYPLAHSMLSRAWLALGYDQSAADEARKALDLGTNLSPADHALLQARYYETRKRWDAAIESYQQLFSDFPDNLEYGLELANAQVRGQRGNEALATIARLRSLAPQSTTDARIDLAEAEAAYSRADNKLVIQAAERAVQGSSASGAKLVAARARVLECRAYANLGQAQPAEAAGIEARSLYREAHDAAGESQALHETAEVPIDQGDLAKARALYTEALSLARHVGNPRDTARELANIGLIDVQQGDFNTGEKMYAEALENFRQVGDRQSMAVVTANTGDLRHAEGRLGESLAEYREALMLAREAGQRSSESIDLQLIGDVLADQGDLEGAMQMYEQASAIQRQIEDKHYYSTTLLSIGRVHRDRGDSSAAKRFYEQALAVRRDIGAKRLAAEAQLFIAELAGDAGDGVLEESLTREALREFQAERAADDELRAYGLIVASLLQQGRHEELQRALKDGRELYEKSQDLTIRLPFEIEEAHAVAALGDASSGAEQAHQVSEAAKSSGLVRIELEAELLLCRIRMQEKGAAAVRAELLKLQKRARARQFELVARKVQSLLDQT